MALHDPRSSANQTTIIGSEREQHSAAIRKTISDEMAVMSKTYLDRITQNSTAVEKVSPLLLYWAYQAASNYSRLYHATGDEQYFEAWEVVQETLRTLDGRWKTAGMLFKTVQITMLNYY